MRTFVLAIVIVASASACNWFRRGGDPPAHRAPETTSIYGDWVLASPIDSTAFMGATEVRMKLEPSTFRLVAHYPGSAITEITGTVSTDNQGLVTLTPTTGGTSSAYASRSMAFVIGQPITLLVSAAGGSLVFKPPREELPVTSSIWHRLEMAEQSGRVKTDST